MNARKVERAAARRRSARRRRLLIGGGLAIAAIAAVVIGRPLLTEPASGDAPGDAAAAAAYVAPVRGDPKAPVTIVEYGDFQCPSCGAFARGSEPELIRRYLDTGKAKLVWKNFAWIGGESKTAAQAAACAGEQSKFWEYHDYLYAHQGGENSGAFRTANLKTFAGALGLDRTRFDSCLDSGRYRAVVEKDGGEVRGLGLNSTPSFTVNGTRVGPSLAGLAAAIDQKLAGR